MTGGAREALVRTMIEMIAGQGLGGLNVQHGSRARVSLGTAFADDDRRARCCRDDPRVAHAELTAGSATTGGPMRPLYRLICLIPDDEPDCVARAWLTVWPVHGSIFAAEATVDDSLHGARMQLWERLPNELVILIPAACGPPQLARPPFGNCVRCSPRSLGVVAEQQGTAGGWRTGVRTT